jgi:dCMP deaminase
MIQRAKEWFMKAYDDCAGIMDDDTTARIMAAFAQHEIYRANKQTTTIPNQQKWDNRFLAMANLVASWSKDPSTQVGAVIVDGKRRILAVGYNGFPRGVSDDLGERLSDRSTKLPRVVHAELNAILNTGVPMSLEGATLYTSMFPCNECAKSIIQTGITRVVAPTPTEERWADSNCVAEEMMDEAGIDLVLM